MTGDWLPLALVVGGAVGSAISAGVATLQYQRSRHALAEIGFKSDERAEPYKAGVEEADWLGSLRDEDVRRIAVRTASLSPQAKIYVADMVERLRREEHTQEVQSTPDSVPGTPSRPGAKRAEQPQVTVLFADIVHSTVFASEVGLERLREIVDELFRSVATVVQRFGGTTGKATGDGIMAWFGAPVALEDHALRASLAALEIQREVQSLAAETKDPDGTSLQLRVGLNSGQMTAAAVGPVTFSALGSIADVAERVEQVAPPGGVMLSESTARLIESTAVLDEPEMVYMKGTDGPVPARLLLSIREAPR